jgi:2-methylaconitate cis-trans-isomerase PrpF
MPMVIVAASAFGCTADERPEDLEADGPLREHMRTLWVEAGLRMALARDGRPMTADELAVSETVPKICLIAPPDEKEAGLGINLRARYFTPQTCHRSMAVTGGSCLAAASLIGGTVARSVAEWLDGLGAEMAEHAVRIGNPAGVLEARITGRDSGGEIDIPAASYVRSAQILLRGHTPIYNASPALLGHYRGLLAAA